MTISFHVDLRLQQLSRLWWLCLHDYVFVFCLCRQRVDSRADLGDFEICNRYNIDNTGLVCKFLLSFSLQLTSCASQIWEIDDICLYKIFSFMSTEILWITHNLLLPVLRAMFWIHVVVAILLQLWHCRKLWTNVSAFADAETAK